MVGVHALGEFGHLLYTGLSFLAAKTFFVPVCSCVGGWYVSLFLQLPASSSPTPNIFAVKWV